MASRLKPLWRCQKCNERFVTANMRHSCGKHTLEELFARSEPHVFQLFKKFARMVRACGRVTVIPQKTRVVFQVRVRFAGCYPRRKHLLCAIALRDRLESPRFVHIEKFAAHFVGHRFKIDSAEQLDAEVQGWLQQAYDVGAQKRLTQSV
jgi:hypothetical protein